MNDAAAWIEALLPVLERWLVSEVLLALGIGALAGLLGGRLLVASALAVGAIGVWTVAAGILVQEAPREVLLGLAVLTALGLFEAVVVLAGGRNAAPQMWGQLGAGLLLFLLLVPVRTLAALANLLPGGKALKSLLRANRR